MEKAHTFNLCTVDEFESKRKQESSLRFQSRVSKTNSGRFSKLFRYCPCMWERGPRKTYQLVDRCIFSYLLTGFRTNV